MARRHIRSHDGEEEGGEEEGGGMVDVYSRERAAAEACVRPIINGTYYCLSSPTMIEMGARGG